MLKQDFTRVSVLETNPEYETIGSNVFEKEEEEAMAYLESIKAKAAKEGVRCETIFHESVETPRRLLWMRRSRRELI